jgi:hypothetical protein
VRRVGEQRRLHAQRARHVVFFLAPLSPCRYGGTSRYTLSTLPAQSGSTERATRGGGVRSVWRAYGPLRGEGISGVSSPGYRFLLSVPCCCAVWTDGRTTLVGAKR